MEYKCSCCKRPFDSNKLRKQHEKVAHPEGFIAYNLRQLGEKHGVPENEIANSIQQAQASSKRRKRTARQP